MPYDEDWDKPLVPSLQVHDDVDPQYTGILDSNGDPIYRDPIRIGFVWSEDLSEPDIEEEGP